MACSVDRGIPNARLRCRTALDCPAGYQCQPIEGVQGTNVCCRNGCSLADGAVGDDGAQDRDAGADSPAPADAPIDTPVAADSLPLPPDAPSAPDVPAGPSAEELAFGCPHDDELRLCYTFDDPGTTLIDGSAHANHGMRNTAGVGLGIRGMALSFTTGAQFATIPEHPAQRLAGSRATFEAWIRPSMSSGTDLVADTIISKWTATSGYTFGAYGRELRVYSGNGGARGAGVLALNAWTHAAVVLAATETIVYLNGVRANAAALPALALVANTEPVTIGKLLPGLTSPETSGWFGLIDVVRVYGRVKTPEEICLDAFRTWSGGACRTVTSVEPLVRR
jgi:hypothetical protein